MIPDPPDIFEFHGVVVHPAPPVYTVPVDETEENHEPDSNPDS